MSTIAETKKGPRCQQCTLRDRPGPVWGFGPQNAQYIYVGHKPGEREVETGEPFTGPTGSVLNRQLFEAGLSRSRGYYTNLVKCLTENNRDPTDHELWCCAPLIEHELKKCEAKVVVAAGDIAQRQIIGNYSTLTNIEPFVDSLLTYNLDGVSVVSRMGCVEQRDGRLYMSTIHPAAIMHFPGFWDASVEHLRKVKQLIADPPPLPRLIVEPTDEDVRRHIEAARTTGVFADDVETEHRPEGDEDDYIGLDYHVDMCGFSAIPYEAIVLTPSRFHLWHEVWSDPNIICAEHNGAYDMFHKSRLFPQSNKLFDTLVAAHLLRSCDKRHALKPYTIGLYTHLPYYDRELEKVHRKAYNAMDCVATLLAANKMVVELKRWKLWDTFWNVEMPMVDICERWRIEGVRIDVEAAKVLRKFIEERVEKGERAMFDIVGRHVNWNNHHDVKRLLYDEFKLPPQKKRNKRKGGIMTITSDAEARVNLRRWIEEKPIRMSAYKRAHTYLYLQDFLSGEKKKLEYFNRIDPNGFIHPHWKTYGQHFMRLSSTPSLQNWPKSGVSDWGGGKADTRGVKKPIEEEDIELPSLRSIVLPDHDDDLFLSCDFEQIEVWIYAKQTNCKWLLEQYEKGEYIYGNIYEEFLNEKFFKDGLPRIKKNKLPTVSERMLRNAKSVPLGFLYGRQAEAVAMQYNWPLDRTIEWRRKWFSKCYELEQSYTRDRYQMQQNGYWMRYPFYVIRFPDRKETQLYNARGQAPAAGVLKTTAILLERELKKFGRERTRTKLSVHDSITINVHGAVKDPHHMVEVYETVVKPVFERPIPELDGFRFRHEATVSSRWDWQEKEYWEWKAEMGL